MRKELHEANRIAWNAATRVHNSHKADQAAFFRAGGSTLFSEEIALLGEPGGLRLLHLQCNAGQDTLSLARLGANVTGVDISDEAIAFARRLAAESGIAARFERADVYDWLAATAAGDERYDIVFSSYGFLCWLSDLARWAAGIAAVLRPGGRFVMIEFHPFAMAFDDKWRPAYPYGGGAALGFANGIGDYVAASGAALAPSGYLEGVVDFVNPNPSHEFPWGVGELVQALLDAGLRLTALREYPYANGCRQFARMRELPGQRFAPPAEMPALPLMIGLCAEKAR